MNVACAECTQMYTAGERIQGLNVTVSLPTNIKFSTLWAVFMIRYCLIELRKVHKRGDCMVYPL